MVGLAPGWLDAPELVAASFSLGVSHPPGHPAYILFSHLFALLPIGSVAFRLALFSAFCFGMASWLTYRAGLHLFSAFPRISSDSAWTRLFWLLPTVGAGLVYSTCLQAVRPEVYTFHAALCMATLERCLAAYHATTQEETDRAMWLALLFAGVGLANHHYLMLLMVPGCLLLSIFSGFWQKRIITRVLISLFILGIGLSTYLYLPLRSKQQPVVHWGAVDSWESMGWTLSAKVWQGSVKVHKSQQPLLMRAFLLLSLYIDQLGIWLCFLAFVGFYLLIRLRLWLGMGVVFWWLGDFLSRVLLEVNLQDADLHGYLIVSFLLMSWGISASILAVLERLLVWQGEWLQEDKKASRFLWLHKVKRYVRPLSLGYILLLLAVLGPLPSFFFAQQPELTANDKPQKTFRCCDRRTRSASLLWMELLEEFLPRNALVFSTYYQTGFLRWYRKVVERSRPDLHFFQRNFLSAKRIAEAEASRYPEHQKILRMFSKRPRNIAAELLRIAQQHSVCIEWYEDLPKSISLYLYPTGLLFQLDPDQKVERNSGGWASDDADIQRQQAHFWEVAYQLLDDEIKRDRGLRDVLLWTHYNHAKVYLYGGRWRAAEAEIKRAVLLSPKSKDILRLRGKIADKIDMLRRSEKQWLRKQREFYRRHPGWDKQKNAVKVRARQTTRRVAPRRRKRVSPQRRKKQLGKTSKPPSVRKRPPVVRPPALPQPNAKQKQPHKHRQRMLMIPAPNLPTRRLPVVRKVKPFEVLPPIHQPVRLHDHTNDTAPRRVLLKTTVRSLFQSPAPRRDEHPSLTKQRLLKVQKSIKNRQRFKKALLSRKAKQEARPRKRTKKPLVRANKPVPQTKRQMLAKQRAALKRKQQESKAMLLRARRVRPDKGKRPKRNTQKSSLKRKLLAQKAQKGKKARAAKGKKKRKKARVVRAKSRKSARSTRSQKKRKKRVQRRKKTRTKLLKERRKKTQRRKKSRAIAQKKRKRKTQRRKKKTQKRKKSRVKKVQKRRKKKTLRRKRKTLSRKVKRRRKKKAQKRRKRRTQTKKKRRRRRTQVRKKRKKARVIAKKKHKRTTQRNKKKVQRREKSAAKEKRRRKKKVQKRKKSRAKVKKKRKRTRTVKTRRRRKHRKSRKRKRRLRKRAKVGSKRSRADKKAPRKVKRRRGRKNRPKRKKIVVRRVKKRKRKRIIRRKRKSSKRHKRTAPRTRRSVRRRKGRGRSLPVANPRKSRPSKRKEQTTSPTPRKYRNKNTKTKKPDKRKPADVE